MPLSVQGVPLGMHNLRHNEIPQTPESFGGFHPLANVYIVISFLKNINKKTKLLK